MLTIAKASSQGVCHCTCQDAKMGVPDQLDCPWCGCGWLFSCQKCGKGFTFGKAVRVSTKLRDFVMADLKQHELPAELMNDKDFVDGCVESIEEMLADLEEGKEYVYFDGVLIPTDYDGRVEFDGLFAAHDLPTLPHLALKEDRDAARHILGDPRYWNDRALPEMDDEEGEGEEDDEEFEDDDEFEDEGPEEGPAR